MPQPANPRPSIDAFYAALVAAYEGSDRETIVGNVTEDFRMASGVSDTVAGKGEFEALVTHILDRYRVSAFQIAIEDVVLLAGHALVTANYVWTLTEKATNSADPQKGRFTMLLKWSEQQGRWQVLRETSP